jgi:dephospho-CoA kinase
MTFILGLTGCIGMGKSTTAHMFREEGIPVHDADAAVHRLYQGKAVYLIEQAFPQSIKDGKVDRGLLSKEVMNNPEAMARLEAIIHPLVRQKEQAFLSAIKAPLVVLDIPLLLETGADQRCHAVLVVTASQHIQKDRVLARQGMTEEKFKALMARQTPDAEKRRKAHFLITTDHGLEDTRRQVKDVVRVLAGKV